MRFGADVGGWRRVGRAIMPMHHGTHPEEAERRDPVNAIAVMYVNEHLVASG